MLKAIGKGLFCLFFLPIYLILSFYLCWRYWVPAKKKYYDKFGERYKGEIEKPRYWKVWKLNVSRALFDDTFKVF